MASFNAVDLSIDLCGTCDSVAARMGEVMQVGHEATNYILLHPSRPEFLMCEEERLDTCIGPFRKLGLSAKSNADFRAARAQQGRELGALGGGFIPNAMGLSKQHLGTYFYGFLAFAVLGVAVLAMMRVMQIRWTRTWAEKGGRARTSSGTSAAFNQAARPSR